MNNPTKQAIRELLMKYTDPKPEYSGMSGWELAEKIAAIVESEPADEDMVREGLPTNEEV